MRRFVIAAIVVAATTGPARAQPATDEFGIERFRLGMDREALLDVEWADVPDHLTWNAGAWIGFAHDPLVVYRDGSAIESLVDRRLVTGLVGSLALWNRLEVGAGVDLIGYQSGSESLMELPANGLGDARLIAKLRLARGDRFTLSLMPVLTVPGGSAGGYLRESGPTFAPALAAGVDGGRWRVAANTGYIIRERVETAGRLVIDDELFGRLGAGIGIGTRAELASTLAIAAPPTEFRRNRLSIEALLGATVHVAPTVDAFAAGGLGLDNGFGTPDWRALAGVRIASARPRTIVASPPPPPRIVTAPPVPAPPPPPAPLAPGAIEGTVVDLEGLPIAGAVVRVTDEQVSVVTDDDGKFQLPARAGPAKLVVERAEYQPTEADATVVSGGKATVTIQLARKVRQGQLRGQVLAFDGKPLAATVEVTARGAAIARATADARGEFAIELPAGTFDVAITADGHIAQKRTVKVKLDGVTVLNIDMRGTR